MSHPHRKADSGFTLLELLISIAILSLGSALGALWLPNMLDRMSLTRDVGAIDRLLASALLDARKTGRDQIVSIQSDGDGTIIKGPSSSITLQRGTTAQWTAAAEIGSDVKHGSILFFGTGGSTGGRISLVRDHARQSVAIDWLSGTTLADEAKP